MALKAEGNRWCNDKAEQVEAWQDILEFEVFIYRHNSSDWLLAASFNIHYLPSHIFKCTHFSLDIKKNNDIMHDTQ